MSESAGSCSVPSAEQVDALADEIATFAARIDIAEHALLTRLRQFDAWEGWASGGFLSCAHWLSRRIGIGLKTAREKVRVARAPGYWNDADKTAAAFMVPPGETELFYRTGDRVRRPLPGAPMTFLARMDSQIKIHGYRVELGEIEAVLAREAGSRLQSRSAGRRRRAGPRAWSRSWPQHSWTWTPCSIASKGCCRATWCPRRFA